MLCTSWLAGGLAFQFHGNCYAAYGGRLGSIGYSTKCIFVNLRKFISWHHIILKYKNNISLTLILTGVAIYGSHIFKARFLLKSWSLINLQKISNPQALSLVAFLLEAFLLIYYFRSKVWKLLIVWAKYVLQGGLWGSIIFVKFLKCCYSHYLWPYVCHSLLNLW